MNLQEYNERKKYIDSLTKEQQYEWYQKVRESLPKLRTFMSDEQVSEIIAAIENYEQRNGIQWKYYYLTGVLNYDWLKQISRLRRGSDL